METTYRTDIDGLRAVAIISVVLFHLGYLPNGYLGVDIFFVISGYLITGIEFKKVTDHKFSIWKFYERRIRRIIPLLLFITLVALLAGLLFMLPADLESLSQSIVASNLSFNNILLYVTSNHYWAVKNDYKPLIHTWSLGVEEQFYLVYPFIFLLLKGSQKRFILPVILTLTILSLSLFLFSDNEALKFYSLQYRFFELSAGGVFAICFWKNKTAKKFSKSYILLFLFLAAVISIVYFNVLAGNDLKVVAVTLLSCGILVLGNTYYISNTIYRYLLSNKLIRGISKISFSIYMWHQLVFVFGRYLSIYPAGLKYSMLQLLLVVFLSVITYCLIESPFRDKQFLNTKPFILITFIFFITVTGASLYVHAIHGIIKDVPELGITKQDRPKSLKIINREIDVNFRYNEDIRALDKQFSSGDKIKVLILGDSYGRDFAHIILESAFTDTIELRYYDLLKKENQNGLLNFDEADYIFYATFNPVTQQKFDELVDKFSLDSNKVWITGIKDFGNSNGMYYNRNKHPDNCPGLRTYMKQGISETNTALKNKWGERYIDLISVVANADGEVLVFTPDCRFISHDNQHLTKFGAVFLAKLLNPRLCKIMKLKVNPC